MATENLTVQKRVLDSAGPGYRALILDRQSYISPEASGKLVELAAKGLPIVVIGTLPNMTIGSTGQGIVSERISGLASAGHSNVKFIESSDSLLKALDALSVKPRVQAASSPPGAAKDLYTVWRSDQASEYLFLYNKGRLATYNITIAANEDKIPRKLNAWTGEQEAITMYSRSSAGINVHITLQRHQTAIIALDARTSQDHVVSHSDNVAKVSYESGKISVLVHDTHLASLTLSNGHTQDIPPLPENINTTLPEIEIGPWNLTLESWAPGPSDLKSESDKQLLHLGLQAALLPWSKIPQVQNVSGVGIYTATLTLPSLRQLPHEQTATVIHFGPVLNTLRAWINGKQLPPVDIFDAQLDISNYLIPGNNSIRVETASTLFNAVKARVDWVKAYGQGPLNPELYTSADWQPHGLVGPVRVKTLRKAVL